MGAALGGARLRGHDAAQAARAGPGAGPGPRAPRRAAPRAQGAAARAAGAHAQRGQRPGL